MKLAFLVLFIAFVESQPVDDDEYKCNFRYCGAELLHFDRFSISDMFRKVEIAQFCINHCTPPVVHEFFQSMVFAITRRIPGQCKGPECAEKNRFVALAKCVEERAWPLLQCTKRLVDLGQVILEEQTDQQKRNYTCNIAVETTQCIEENLVVCGDLPFSLVKEIFSDVIKLGIKGYCHSDFRNEFFIGPSTLAPFQERMKYFTDITPKPGPRPYPQFVKSYRTNSVGRTSVIGYLSGLMSLLVSLYFLKL